MFKPDTSTASAVGSLTLLQLKGIGAKSVGSLVEHFQTLGSVREAAKRRELDTLLRRVPSSVGEDSEWENAADEAQRIMERATVAGVRVLSIADTEYPELLRLIPDRPQVIFLKGTLRSGRKNVACIGTRQPSSFGTLVTQRIVEMLVEDDWSIVSGLAIGVDSEAHRQALANSGHTVAILANGLDKVYPRENQKLAEEILEKGGALLSEQPFGVPATPNNLVQRDRLQSGMSVATVVMQTDIEGGSMHTARFTLTQCRQLLAPVPTGSHATEPKSQGILALTSKTGTELAAILKKVPRDYADLLRQQFSDRPPAIPIMSRNDYRAILNILTARCESDAHTLKSTSVNTGSDTAADKPKDTLF